MNRPAIIAVTAAIGGILIATSAAGIAVINASSSADSDSASVEVVASSAAEPSPAETGPSTDASAVDVAATAQAIASSAPAPAPALPPLEKPVVSRAAAKAEVVDAAGGQVLDVGKATRKGTDAWTVQVKRGDGSVITGYVDMTTGVVFDWSIDQAAPQPAAPRAAQQAAAGSQVTSDPGSNSHSDHNSEGNGSNHEGENDDD